MNKERLGEIIGIITKHPEQFGQGRFHSNCGTSHCVAGWCDVLGREKTKTLFSDECRAFPQHLQETKEYSELAYKLSEDCVATRNYGESYLELTKYETFWLFDARRSLQDIKNFWEFEGIPGKGFTAEEIDWPSLAPGFDPELEKLYAEN